jgi:hypothetical protein
VIPISFRVIGFDEAQERIHGIASGMDTALFNGIRRGSLIMERAVKQQITTQFGGGKEWRASFTSAAAISGNTIVGLVGSPHPASRIQELGGTIRPKNARALAIPMSKVAKRHRPRDFADAFVLKASGGRAFLVRSRGLRGRGGLEFLYVLARKATLKPSHYLTNAQRKGEPQVVALVGGRIGSLISTGRA